MPDRKSHTRRRFFGRRVKLNYLLNMKSGMCPEDCGYCSQRLVLDRGLSLWVAAQEIVECECGHAERRG